MKVSRKTIIGILGGIGAIALYLAQQFGLADLELIKMIPAVVVGALYILFESKVDFQRIKNALSEQTGKLKDGAFWAGLISVLLTEIVVLTGWNIPIEVIVGVLGSIMSLIFAKRYVEVKE